MGHNRLPKGVQIFTPTLLNIPYSWTNNHINEGHDLTKKKPPGISLRSSLVVYKLLRPSTWFRRPSVSSMLWPLGPASYEILIRVEHLGKTPLCKERFPSEHDLWDLKEAQLRVMVGARHRCHMKSMHLMMRIVRRNMPWRIRGHNMWQTGKEDQSDCPIRRMSKALKGACEQVKNKLLSVCARNTWKDEHYGLLSP